MIGKHRPHLGFGFDVGFLAQKAETLGIVEIASGADGQQHIVGLRVFPLEIVRIVGGDYP
jgi:hypothetical protein